MTLRSNFGFSRRPVTLATMPSPVMIQSAPAQPLRFDSVTSPTEHKKNDVDAGDNGGAETTNINNMLANNKEKTPMCLVNELARYNKIPHQYRLTNEQGPAHRKQFTVTLKLGDEEYTAEGASIKKAQHQAASIALSKTNYKHPPSKPRSILRMGRNNITPTVELNAWAMKRGELATYVLIPPHALPVGPPPPPPCPGMAPPNMGPMTNFMPPPMGPPPPHFSTFPAFNYRPAFNQRPPLFQMRPPNACGEMAPWGPPRPPINMFARPPLTKHQQERMYAKPSIYPGGHPTFTVMVKVGSREFMGEGATAQLARHNAASKALDEIRQLPLPDERSSSVSENGSSSTKEDGSEAKSPISLVHEVALRRNLTVKFEVVRVSGPPHMRSFHTVCMVGDFTTEGIGNGKKLSKKRASEKMLEELKKLPPESPCATTAAATANAKVKRKPTQKKKSRNLIKDPKPATPVESPPHTAPADKEKDEMNPISRLIQIQQAKKEQEPLYTLVEEKGAPRRREFIMAVKIGELSCQGSGPNKKLAKRAAAEAMLLELGYSRPPAGSTPAPSTKPSNGKESRKLTDTPSVGGTGGRQLVPGLLLVPDTSYSPPIKGTVISPATSSMAKELLQTGKTGADSQSSQSTAVVSPKDQLLYLAQLLDFKVQFSDFPKGNHSEYLSLVTLSTCPPHVCHGAGHTVEASHDQAALTALQMLAEMGLDMFSNKKETSSASPSSVTEG
ncbi:hypothetical protein ONE63_008401 [Megalurothrips usitatus]|uniref:DRBM domain-containing protein n=1 Tax=Megalurothrips usitatus TaxID=439358 RepID=A0AAV7XSX5_9NEOP|nr:hypothetical protein ONE63_008401 [Megalurothrips usitatus]